MHRIGLIAAMQEEINPFLRLMGEAQQESVGSQRVYRFKTGEQSICLVQSGMGSASAASGTRLLIDRFRPELIISFGFAGSLSRGLNVGELVVADRILTLQDDLLSDLELFNSGAGNVLPEAVRGAFVTTVEVTPKKALAAGLPGDVSLAVVEMETAAVAQVAQIEGIPLIAVRAISDGFEEELGFSLNEFCDQDLNLQKWRVAMTIAKKPWILPQLIRLSRNSRSAARALAGALPDILSELK